MQDEKPNIPRNVLGDRLEEIEAIAASLDEVRSRKSSASCGSDKNLTIEHLLYECTLISQKIEEWRKMLEAAQDDPSRRRNHFKSIGKKLDKIQVVMYDFDKRQEWSQELVNKTYYDFVQTLDKLHDLYKSWRKKRKKGRIGVDVFKRLPYVKELLEELKTVEEGAVVADDWSPGCDRTDFAVSLTARILGIPEDRVRRTRKKIYQEQKNF